MTPTLRTLTMVFTDLVNSTQLKATVGDLEAARRIEGHKALLRGLLRVHGGREIDNAGDGFFLTFDTPSQAVQFGVRVQEAHARHAELPPVRVGIHLGQVVETPTEPGSSKPVDVAGLAVDLAARVQGLAEPGQVLLSDAVHTSARQFVRPEDFESPLAWRKHGPYAFKGFDAPLEVWEVGLEGTSPLRPPVATAKAEPVARDGWPSAEVAGRLLTDSARAAIDRFVAPLVADGSFSELHVERREATSHLRVFLDGALPGLLILGPSGVGKTSLLARLATEPATGAGDDVVVPLSAAVLGNTVTEIEAAIVASLGLPTTKMADVVRRVSPPRRVILAIDALDRHPSPAVALEAVRRIAAVVRDAPKWRVIATLTLTSWESLARNGARVEPSLFYAPGRGVSTAERLPGVVLGPLVDVELEDAYERLRTSGGATTPWADVSAEARQALTHPMLLRMAMDVFAGRPLPERILSGELLLVYASRRIFQHPRRCDFVVGLLDRMIERRERSLALADLWNDARLRPVALEDGPASPLVQLVDEHVLAWGSRPAPFGLPLPDERRVEFAFENLLEYLLMWRVAERGRERADAVPDAIAAARAFPALRGAMLQLLAHLARAGVVESLGKLGDDAWGRALLEDVLIDLFETSPDVGRRVTAEIADHAAVAHALASAGERLFVRGRWPLASAVLEAALALPGLSPRDVADVENRLGALCKSLDRWAECRDRSARALALLGDDPGHAADRARAAVNLGSALWDLGNREGGARAFRRALADAERVPAATGGRAGSGLEAASASNNLGVHELYSDDLDAAERTLVRGLALVPKDSILVGYLETNLQLVHMTRSLVDPAALDEAERLAVRCYDRFKAAGHLQGTSYAASNLGIVHLARGRWDAAREGFAETIRIGERLGEKWTPYGARANLALLALVGPSADAREALRLASGSVASARDTGDPKGIGDAGLVAARAALDLGDADAAEAYLVPAAEAFASLGQSLGEAMAELGLAEACGLRGDKETADVHLARGRDRLARTSLGALPPRLLALPWHMLFLVEIFG